MPVITDDSGAGTEDSCTYWENQLSNLKILLYRTTEAIQALTTGNHKAYKLDTGQSTQEVTRLDLGVLRDNITEYTSQIQDLEIKLGHTKSAVQVIPAW